MVEQAFLFDKKEVHLHVLIAARHVFASRPSDMFFAFSGLWLSTLEGNFVNHQAH